ncbi:MAG TPA: hypothetical protein VMB05_10890 [Solirubrobacteraceae bacterium]|nr:hypothetical protein [Solirubrobacteraceae bacterium]
MSFSRVGLAERIIAGGAVALFVFLFFLDWYGGTISGLLPGSHISGATVEATGWEAFTSSRWVWLATILLALGSVLAAARAYRPEGPVQLGAVVFGMGTLSSVLIIYRIIYHPGADASGHGLQISYGIKFGIWLGLLAALAIALGGYLQLLAEGRRQVSEPRVDRERGGDPESAFSGLLVARSKAGQPARGPDRGAP